jgi:hypothetical protein
MKQLSPSPQSQALRNRRWMAMRWNTRKILQASSLAELPPDYGMLAAFTHLFGAQSGTEQGIIIVSGLKYWTPMRSRASARLTFSAAKSECNFVKRFWPRATARSRQNFSAALWAAIRT